MNDLSALRMSYRRPEALDEVCAQIRATWPAGDARVTALRLVATAREADAEHRAAMRLVDELRRRMSRKGTWWCWWTPLRASTWTAWWWGRVIWGSAAGPGVVSWRFACVERRRLVRGMGGRVG